METERSPLGTAPVPKYTFLGSGELPKKRLGLRCCICATLTLLLVVASVILIALLFTSGLRNENEPRQEALLNSSQTSDGLFNLKWPIEEEKYEDLVVDLSTQKRAFDAGVDGLNEKDNIEENLLPLPVDSPAFRHHLATYTTAEAQQKSRLGFVLNAASKEINKRCDVLSKNRKKPRRWIFTERHSARITSTKCQLSPYRTATGECNNLKNKSWGAALQPFRRILLPKYEDGVSKPRVGSDGNPLPSAREISLSIHRPAYGNDGNFTVMLAVWGQFIDHDITATAMSRGRNGSPISCCSPRTVHPECFSVPIGPSDPFYLRCNVTCMEFVRSAPAPIQSFGPRDQLNQVTSFLDGSVVYGNDEEAMSKLRTFSKGELKMLKTDFGDLLPISEDLGDGCNRREEYERGRYCFLSGDERSNENLLLTSMHLLWARQHNLVARALLEINPRWTDESLFQETRKIIGAQIQHITYNEFLPSILPEELIIHLNISAKPTGHHSNLYDPSVDPTIANVFAAAAFRFGHSLLPGLMKISRDDSGEQDYVELHKMLFNPFKLFEMEFLEGCMKGAMDTSSSISDVHFSTEMTEKLFQRSPQCPHGLDLVSLNIQRGRDHGLPSYPDWRKVCGLRAPKHFEDLRDEIDESTLKKLKEIYRSVDDVDVYTAGLAEKPVRGGLVGPTITCLLADQFLRLKIGDRFWYEGEEEPQKFTPEQLQEIRKTSLAKIICDTSEVSQSQPNVMKRVQMGNEMRACDNFPSLDYTPWKQL